MAICQTILLSREHILRAKQIARALGHKLRIKILLTLQEIGKATVTEIRESLHLDQSVCSQQLAILRRANIIKPERDGKYVYYSIDEQQIMHILLVFSDLSIPR